MPPSWFLQDINRFPRAQDIYGRNLQVVSVFDEINRNADAKAFSALMEHLRKTDMKENTVIMVQVENEPGIRKMLRDYSQKANSAFHEQVPTQLMNFLVKEKDNLVPGFRLIWMKNGFKTSGSWEEIFDVRAPEVFMSWYVAKYINYISKSGKDKYNLPTYANAWLPDTDEHIPGQYPSGGPVYDMIPVWQAAAPDIDMFAPDIYRPDFKPVCDRYILMGNPLFYTRGQAR
ncbi:MAG: hypothetical protein HC906_11850 [Bacteroidales bacterium]|nr:hypothetical protein [Bacteroidales bacterium]